jgi:hypothetical protein
MSRIRVERITDKQGTGAPLFPNGISVVGLTSLSNVVAGIATFTSDVSIGGTLTYEDVTNIDSVGMVTARSGIEVTAGGANIVGVVTASTGIDAASNLILKTGGTERVRILSDGKTGIGTSPYGSSARLQIYEPTLDRTLILDSGNANGPHMRLWRQGAVQHYIGCSAGFGQGNYEDLGVRAKRNIIFHPGDSSTERLRIGSAGQIGLSGANYGTSGQVMTSGGASAAPSWATPSGGLSMVDEWGQFSGDGNSSYGPWNNTTFGSGSTYGQLQRSTYSNMPIGAGMTHTNGLFQFPNTGIYEIAAKWTVGRHSQNTGILIKVQLSTNSGSSFVSGYDSNGLDLARDDVNSSYSRLNGTINNLVIVNVTNASTFRVKFQIATSGGNLEYYIRPSSKIIFKKLN